MRRTFLIFLAMLWLPLQLSAENICPRIGDSQGELFDLGLNVEGAEPLYVQLADGASVGDRVTFDIRVDGMLTLTEEVELMGFSALGGHALDAVGVKPVVELLAAAPARLDFLRRAAENGVVEVSFALGEVSLGSHLLTVLEDESSALREQGVRPFDLRSSLRQIAAPAVIQNKYSCEELCDLEQDDCYLNRCGQFGSASCYNACDIEFIRCLEGCGICQPSSSTETVDTLDSTTATSTIECKRSFFNPSVSGIQRLMDRRIKRTETTTTINEDCSETVTTNVTYYHTYCWRWINYNGCFPLVVENPGANC